MKALLKLIVLLLLCSCGHEKYSPTRFIEAKAYNGHEIPWVNAGVAESSQTKLGMNLAELMGAHKYEGNKGTSGDNIYTVRDATVQMAASMPFAMPFYCDPACYEASIILGLQACQPYRFVVWYYYQYLPEDAGPRGRRHAGYCSGR